MKKIKLSLVVAMLLCLFVIISSTNTASTDATSPPLNRCGLYGTQSTCSTCHSYSGTNNATNSIALSGNPSGYTLGQTYTVTVTATAGSRYGFEMACIRQSNNANAGTFGSISGTGISSTTVSGKSISFIYPSTINSSGTWTFHWTAPTTDVGNVVFYLATNSANANNSTSGDKVKTRVLTLPAACTGTLATPTGLSTTNISSTSATFQWAAVAGAATYTVQGRKVGSTTWTTLAPTANTSRTVSTLQACKNYEWAVRANCSDGVTSSAFSSAVSFTTTGCGAAGKTETSDLFGNAFELFPNPANNECNLYYESSKAGTQADLLMTDLSGKIVQQQSYSLDEGANHLKIDISQLPAGYYIVHFSHEQESYYQRLIVE